MRLGCLLCLLLVAPLWPIELSRTVLGIYSSSQASFNREEHNLIRLAAEMPLNHLGCIVRYCDLAAGLPSEEAAETAFAILSWLDLSASDDPIGYCQWLVHQVSRGKRLILMGQFPSQATPSPHLTDLFRAIGLNYLGEERSPSRAIGWQDPTLIGFDHPVNLEELHSLPLVHIRDPRVQPYLLLTSSHRPGVRTVAVCTTPRGGYCAPGTALYHESATQEMRWIVNPFLFFEEALGLRGIPRFDTTTLFGRRIFFTHIDEEGIDRPSGLAGYRTCGEAVLAEIIDRYPLPMTLSFHSLPLDPNVRAQKGVADDLFGERCQDLTTVKGELSRRNNVEIIVQGGHEAEMVGESGRLDRMIERYGQTNSPRRIAPMSLSYRFSSAEREENLYTLRLILEYVLHQEPIPIFATRYLEMARDFFTATTEQLADGGWRFKNYGRCQTIRFDGVARWPDLERSTGLLGYTRWGNSLYVHLTRATSATLYLKERESNRPYLVDSTAEIFHLQFGEGKIGVTLYSPSNAILKFANLNPNSDYRLLRREMGEPISSTLITTRSDPNGNVQIDLPIYGTTIVEMELVVSSH